MCILISGLYLYTMGNYLRRMAKNKLETCAVGNVICMTSSQVSIALCEAPFIFSQALHYKNYKYNESQIIRSHTSSECISCF